MQEDRTIFSTKCARITDTDTYKKNHLSFRPHTKVNSKWSPDLQVKSKTINSWHGDCSQEAQGHKDGGEQRKEEARSAC